MPEDAPKAAETVAVKRRRLRSALREARKGAGLTQPAVAKKLSWSTSKVVRIEQGAVPVTPIDVKAMLNLYGIDNEERVEGLAKLAIETRELKGFLDFEDIYGPDTLELFRSESSAQVIYKHEPTVLPGLLQTEDYSHALLLALGNSEDTARRKLEARSERQVLLERPDHPELNIVIGEAAVSRPIGGTEVMRRQLDQLRMYAGRDNINLYLLPFSAGAHRGLGEAFTILQFSNPEDPDVLYVENVRRLTISHDTPTEFDKYLDLFAHLQGLAERSGDFLATLDQITASRFH